ncbi:hypothetical protein [Bradyrhizobium macuxiense]|uniref:hypothetical protein n=1 Tax=Bradyrhizobium macuxiense TaxID=1755647 RepID=UPI0011BF9486|nr:hypothetical protein [Bradyrhizobium macuxiense]
MKKAEGSGAAFCGPVAITHQQRRLSRLKAPLAAEKPFGTGTSCKNLGRRRDHAMALRQSEFINFCRLLLIVENEPAFRPMSLATRRASSY